MTKHGDLEEMTVKMAHLREGSDCRKSGSICWLGQVSVGLVELSQSQARRGVLSIYFSKGSVLLAETPGDQRGWSARCAA